MNLHTAQGPSARGTTSRDPGTIQPTETPHCGLAPTLGTSRPALGHAGVLEQVLASRQATERISPPRAAEKVGTDPLAWVSASGLMYSWPLCPLSELTHKQSNP